MASLNSLYILILLFFHGFKDTLKTKFYRKKNHYILILDSFDQIKGVEELNLPSILLLKKGNDSKENARKYGRKNQSFLFVNNWEAGLKKAGILSPLTTILSLSLQEETNLSLLMILNDLLPVYNKAVLNGLNFDTSSFINPKKNIVVYDYSDLVARDFIERYPLYHTIPTTMIDKEKGMLKDTHINHFFLGSSLNLKRLLELIIINYPMVNDVIKTFLVDENASQWVEQFNGEHYANQFVSDLLKDSSHLSDYFDLEAARFNLTPLDCPIKSYHLKKEILSHLGSFNLFYLDYKEESISYDEAIHLHSYLTSNTNLPFKIYVRLSDINSFFAKDLSKKGILIFGEDASIRTKRVMVDQALDNLAKEVNAYYERNYHGTIIDVEESWNESDLFSKNSSRAAAINISTKLNLLGLSLKSGEKGLSKEEFLNHYNPSMKLNRDLEMVNYNYQNPRINLGILEHYRWNAFMIINNFQPMKKIEIFKDNKYHRKNMEKHMHSNLLSLKGLLELENELKSFDGLTKELREKESKILIKDFDLMDNLYEILNHSALQIIENSGSETR